MMSRPLSRIAIGTAAMALSFGTLVVIAPAAQALETYTSVTTGSSQTFADGTTATATFANGGATSTAFNGESTLNYKVTAADDSSVTITFSSSQSGWTGISDLRLYYGWVNEGDYSQILTNEAPTGLNLSDATILTTYSNYCTSNPCPGNPIFTANGLIKAPDGTAGVSYIGNIQLHFATPITSITVLGPADRPAAAGSYGAGVNGIGFSLPVSTHTVTFDANGGTNAMTNQVAGVPTALTANAFTRDGFIFDEWTTLQGGGGDAYADGAEYSFGADTTLFAQWTRDPAAPRIVTFDANGGSGSMTNQTAGVAGPLSPNTLTRDGFTFLGWNTQQDGQGTPYADGETYDFSSDQTLWAQWAENHTVTFDPNGGSGTMPAQTIGGSAPLTQNSLTRDGYIFAGWNTQQDGQGTPYADEANFDFSSDQTLFAQWTLDPLTSSGIGTLVNTGLALLGPAGTAGVVLALGSPFFLLSNRFRKVRALGAVVLHKSAHVTVTSPATIFDRLRAKNN